MLLFVPAHSKCPRGASGWMLVLCDYGRASSGFTRALVRGRAIDSNPRTRDALQDGYMAGAGTFSAGKITEFSPREIWDRRLTGLSAFLAKPDAGLISATVLADVFSTDPGQVVAWFRRHRTGEMLSRQPVGDWPATLLCRTGNPI